MNVYMFVCNHLYMYVCCMYMYVYVKYTEHKLINSRDSYIINLFFF